MIEALTQDEINEMYLRIRQITDYVTVDNTVPNWVFLALDEIWLDMLMWADEPCRNKARETSRRILLGEEKRDPDRWVME